jgi:AraC-like DNA-binding protein
MPTLAPDYFRYFATSPDLARWGLGLTGAGHATVQSGAAYPPNRHPADHHFDWSRGRVLDAMQIVLIASGSGTFESKPTGLKRISAGMGFCVLPGVWHRYRPDPATGWEESWIEVRGPTVERLLASEDFAAATAVRPIDPAIGLEAALTVVHDRAREAAPGFDAELAAAALAVLAAWDKALRVQPERSRVLRIVTSAERHLAEHLTEPVNVESLARRLGIAYSHFRRVFKAHTGFSPWQYVLHLRLARARRLLASGDATLEEIAARLGFSSPFHFSSAFKRANGVAPDHWRRQLAERRPADGA